MLTLSPSTLTEGERKAIIRATAGNPRDHLIYSLALGTGLRLAEIVGLNVGDAFFPDGRPRTRVRIRPALRRRLEGVPIRQRPVGQVSIQMALLPPSSYCFGASCSMEPNMKSSLFALRLALPALLAAGTPTFAAGRHELAPGLTIGPEIPVSPIRMGTARQPAVSAGETNWLVAWTADGRTVHAARVNADGVVMDHPDILIGDGADPAVAWDGTNWIVAWTKFDEAFRVHIFALRVSPSGSVLDPGGFQVSSGFGSFPAVASNGTLSLVAWQVPRSETFNIYAARVQEGTVLDPQGGPLTNDPTIDEGMPGVSWNGNNFLVVRWRRDPSSHVGDWVASRLEASGAILAPDPVFVARGFYPFIPPAVASDRSSSLIGVVDDAAIVGYENALVPVDASGSNGPPIPFAPSQQHASEMFLGWTGVMYLAGWLQELRQDSEILAARVDHEGRVL